MGDAHSLKLILGSVSVALLLTALSIILYRRRRRPGRKGGSLETGESEILEGGKVGGGEDLITFLGCEDLTIYDILDAPGEVIGKSSYGTIYKATLERRNCFRVLRFLRPACCGTTKGVVAVVRLLGLIRHQNLVPLEAFYAGSKGEKLLVHPFYRHGNLAQFIKAGKSDSYNWDIICWISIGMARGLDHLHTGLHRPLVHGNLKSKNILLDQNFQPRLSDFGLHLLLNLAAAQEMLESSATEGYKPPELMKIKDASPESDIYGLGVILLELLTGKEPITEHPSPIPDSHLPSTIRNSILNHRVTDLLHPSVLLNSNNGRRSVTDECVLKFFRLALSCCSPSASVRPDVKQVLRRLEEIRM